MPNDVDIYDIVQVPITMTASELVSSILEKLDNKDKSRRRWAIFEMISNSDLGKLGLFLIVVHFS